MIPVQADAVDGSDEPGQSLRDARRRQAVVVAVDLPELRPVTAEGLIEIASDGVRREIERCRSQRTSELTADAELLRERTREQRFPRSGQLALAPLRASIIVLFHNQLELNRLRSSIFDRTELKPNFVRAGGQHHGGSRQFAEEIAIPPIKTSSWCRNESNESFARANNLGVAASSGEYIVFAKTTTRS